MYRIISTTSGKELGVVDKPFYIKIGASGCKTPAAQDEATGVALHSIPYDLLGHDEIKGEDTVIVSEFDGGEMVSEQQKVIDDMLISTLEG